MTTSDVRYGRDNILLRHALWQVWKHRCYWCLTPKDFTDTQIDHIVPKTLSPKDLKEVRTAFSLPANYDLDDPRNLGPICASCNGPNGKGARNLARRQSFGDRLDKAESLRAEVVKRVRAFRSNSKLGVALLTASEADLGDDEARRLFEELAPGVVQRLALLGEDKADFLTSRTETVDLTWEPLDVEVTLNARGRTAATVLKEFCGCDLADVLAAPMDDLLSKLAAYVEGAFESIDAPTGTTDPGPPTANFLEVSLDSVDFTHMGENIEFECAGRFDASLTASLVQGNDDGDGLKELQGEAAVTGRYVFSLQWTRSMKPGTIDFIETLIDPHEADIWTE